MRFDPLRPGQLLLLALSLALTGCDRLGEPRPEALADSRPAAAEPPAARTIAPPAAAPPPTEAAPLRQRHVAVRHDLAVFTAADAVEAAWKAAEPAVLEAGMWLPLKTAVLRAGHVLASSPWRR